MTPAVNVAWVRALSPGARVALVGVVEQTVTPVHPSVSVKLSRTFPALRTQNGYVLATLDATGTEILSGVAAAATTAVIVWTVTLPESDHAGLTTGDTNSDTVPVCPAAVLGV